MNRKQQIDGCRLEDTEPGRWTNVAVLAFVVSALALPTSISALTVADCDRIYSSDVTNWSPINRQMYLQNKASCYQQAQMQTPVQGYQTAPTPTYAANSQSQSSSTDAGSIVLLTTLLVACAMLPLLFL